jgi:hypothetical protein
MSYSTACRRRRRSHGTHRTRACSASPTSTAARDLIDPSFREQTAIKFGSQPMDMAFRGDELFAACQGDDSAHVIDIPNRRMKTSFKAGVKPSRMMDRTLMPQFFPGAAFKMAVFPLWVVVGNVETAAIDALSTPRTGCGSHAGTVDCDRTGADSTA